MKRIGMMPPDRMFVAAVPLLGPEPGEGGFMTVFLKMIDDPLGGDAVGESQNVRDASRSVGDQGNMIGHDDVGADGDVGGPSCLVEGVCEDAFALIGPKYGKSIFGDGGQVVEGSV